MLGGWGGGVLPFSFYTHFLAEVIFFKFTKGQFVNVFISSLGAAFHVIDDILNIHAISHVVLKLET